MSWWKRVPTNCRNPNLPQFVTVSEHFAGAIEWIGGLRFFDHAIFAPADPVTEWVPSESV